MNLYPPLKPPAKGLITLLITGIFGTSTLGIYLASRPRPATTNPLPAVAQTEVKAEAITALGRIEPQGEVVTIGGPQEERIGQLFVKEGQQVQKGEVLAYLDSYEEQLAQKNAAASQLEETRARFATESSSGEAQIQEAKSRIDQIDQPQQLEIAAQQASVERVKAELETAQRELQRFEYLQQQGAVSNQALDDKTLNFRSKQEELAHEQATLLKLEQARLTNLQNAKMQLQTAQANLKRSQSQVQVESAQRNLELASARLERTIIRAPQAGQVLKVFSHAGESISTKGILELGNTQTMYVVAEVYETDVSRIKVGQTATLTSSAFPAELKGVVKQIGLTVYKNDVLNTDPAAQTDARVVEVKIQLLNSQPVAGLTNLQVRVAIHP